MRFIKKFIQLVKEKNLFSIYTHSISESFQHLVRGILKPRKITGTVEIIASTQRYKVGDRQLHLPKELKSKMQADLVRDAEAVPSVVVLLNEKSASKGIRLERGSGHFALIGYDSNVLDAEISDGITQVTNLHCFY